MIIRKKYKCKKCHHDEVYSVDGSIEYDNNVAKLVKYSRRVEDEIPWLYEHFYHQFDSYHVDLIKALYQYVIDHVAETQFESGKHTFKNIYVVGSWFGLHLYNHFIYYRKEKDVKIKFTFIDRNRDFTKAVEIMSEVWEDPDIKGINADIVFDEIDFSDADLVLIPYAEEIMPLQHLNLNIDCPIVAAFTYHRYQRVRNRNFSEPMDTIEEMDMKDNERVYLKQLGHVNDWVYADIVTITKP